MNAKNLSERLKKVASFVEQDSKVADIGSDHAYLPCYLVHTGKIRQAIAGEVVKGPYESAVKQVKSEGLENEIEVRFGNGLEVIQPQDEVQTITIAGMGGPLIASILEDGKDKLETVETLILQPNVHAKAIREWAIQNGWKLVEETILEENTKIYEILVLKKGKMVLDEQTLLVGPFLLQEKSPIFHKKWSTEMSEWHRILKQLPPTAMTSEVVLKREELERKIVLVKESLDS